MSLDNSYLTKNAVSVGAATGSISSIIENDGTSLQLRCAFNAENDVGQEQMYFNSTLEWSSPSSWVSAGSIGLKTVLRVVDPYIDDTADDDPYYGHTGYRITVPEYTATNTNNAQQNYVTYSFKVCNGEEVIVTMCGTGGSYCSGDTYLRLYSGSTQLFENDDYCSRCSQMQVTAYFSSSNTCSSLDLRMGCYSSGSCGGIPVITVVCHPGYTCSEAPPVPTMLPTPSPVHSTTGYYVNRDFSLAFSYGDNVYFYESANKDSISSYEHLHVVAKGGYGGDFYNWYVSVYVLLVSFCILIDMSVRNLLVSDFNVVYENE